MTKMGSWDLFDKFMEQNKDREEKIPKVKFHDPIPSYERENEEE